MAKVYGFVIKWWQRVGCTVRRKNTRPIAIFWCKIRRILVIFSKSTPNSETLYISFESPNTQLLWARGTRGVVAPYGSQALWNETRSFLLKGAWPLYELATPPELLANKNCILGLSNEVYNVSVQQLVLEIRAVKVERSKKTRFTKEIGLFFDRSTLTARISRTSCCTETLYTSFESHDTQLLWARRARALVSK